MLRENWPQPDSGRYPYRLPSSMSRVDELEQHLARANAELTATQAELSAAKERIAELEDEADKEARVINNTRLMASVKMSEVRAAVTALLDNDGSRGCFDSGKCYEARQRLEQLFPKDTSLGAGLTALAEELQS